MLIWIFMLMDLFVLFVISFAHFNIISNITFLLLFAGGYLTLKAIAFRDVMSMIDLIVAVYILLMIFGVRTSIYYVIAFWFLYKLLFTIVGNM